MNSYEQVRGNICVLSWLCIGNINIVLVCIRVLCGCAEAKPFGKFLPQAPTEVVFHWCFAGLLLKPISFMEMKFFDCVVTGQRIALKAT